MARGLLYLIGTVTQGSNDAFAQAELPTGLAAIGNQAFRVKEIIINTSALPAVNGCNSAASLTRKSFAASPAVTERSLIIKQARTMRLTTSGATIEQQPGIYKYVNEDDLLIVEDPLYIQISSAATAQLNAAIFRIGYEQVRITEVDRLAILAATLAQ